MVYRFDPATSSVSAAGQLPVPVAYAAGVVWEAGEAGGAVGYLIGGEDGPRPVPTVTTLRLVPSGQIMPQASQAPWLAPASGPGLLTPGSDPSVPPADILIADHKNNRPAVADGGDRRGGVTHLGSDSPHVNHVRNTLRVREPSRVLADV